MNLLRVQILRRTFIRIINPKRKRKIFIVFDDMIVDITSKKKSSHN